MFETAELGQKVGKKEYEARLTELRAELLEAQVRMREIGFPAILVFAGVDGAGKTATTNLLNSWMDPRWISVHAYGEPSDEEAERPEFWRYWRDLPGNGELGVFLSAWYSRPLLDRVHGKISQSALDDRLERILSFERTLAESGAVILKCWMHLGKKPQKKRLRALEKDPLQSWRVTEKDWKNYKLYDEFVGAAEHIIMRTSVGRAPWAIIEGADPHFRSLEVGTKLLDAIQRKVAERNGRVERPEGGDGAVAGPDPEAEASGSGSGSRILVLSSLDLAKKLEKKDYLKKRDELQARLNLLAREAWKEKTSTILVFEGWDAGGKGGAIRRITPALDARDYKVIQIAAPTDEEKAHHYLWRFWRRLARAGRVTIFDRSWYGRVLVERIEGFATETEWRRAYAEINEFERQLVDHGTVLVKFWLHISPEEQQRRFEARAEVPYKRWKLTDEDLRNREKWGRYELAVNDMIERTSTQIAPWVLVPAEDKRNARVEVLSSVCDALEKRLH
jgi:polyphosphate:AMP phosphotransferase